MDGHPADVQMCQQKKGMDTLLMCKCAICNCATKKGMDTLLMSKCAMCKCAKKGMDTLLMPLSWWDMFPHQLAHSNEDAWARGLQVFPQACC